MAMTATAMTATRHIDMGTCGVIAPPENLAKTILVDI